MTSPHPRDVVITGVGVVSSIGIGRPAFWEPLCRGACGIAELPAPLGRIGGLAVGGALLDFDAKQFVRPRKALKVMSREIRTAFAAAMLAKDEAGLDEDSLPGERIATVFGSEMMSGGPDEMSDAMLECGVREASPRVADFGDAAMRKMYPLWMLKYLPNMAACHVGIALGALGPNNSLITGDTSALSALIESVSVLERGDADCVLTGGSGTRLSPTRLVFHGGLPAATVRQPIWETPRPMGRERDGVVNGEGAAVLVLETRRIAKLRGVNPRARVVGSASRFVASPEFGRPNGAGLEAAIQASLRQAQLVPEDVGAVVSQAMGHPHLDQAEADALFAVFGKAMPVTAPIGAVGHTGAACGAIALSVGTMMLESATIPATVNAALHDDACRVRLLAEPEPLAKPVVLVLGHTLMGHATAVLLAGESS